MYKMLAALLDNPPLFIFFGTFTRHILSLDYKKKAIKNVILVQEHTHTNITKEPTTIIKRFKSCAHSRLLCYFYV